jgi:molybdate transport system substrate-binding protein
VKHVNLSATDIDANSRGSITLFSGLALRDALTAEILPDFLSTTGVTVTCTFEPTSVLLQRIEAGQVPDVLLGVSESVDALVAQRVLSAESVRCIVSSAVGIGVPLATAVPHFDSSESFIEFLLSARSVAYSRSGASGIYFSGLLERLGIGERVNARATVFEKGFTADAVADGRADVAIQQLSELMAVDGVYVVDAFPPELQHLTSFSAALATASTVPQSATLLLETLASKSSIDAFKKTGLVEY